jgi:hypothetical protein
VSGTGGIRRLTLPTRRSACSVGMRVAGAARSGSNPGVTASHVQAHVRAPVDEFDRSHSPSRDVGCQASAGRAADIPSRMRRRLATAWHRLQRLNIATKTVSVLDRRLSDALAGRSRHVRGRAVADTRSDCGMRRDRRLEDAPPAVEPRVIGRRDSDIASRTRRAGVELTRWSRTSVTRAGRSPMTMARGLDLHRRRITFDAVEVLSGEDGLAVAARPRAVPTVAARRRAATPAWFTDGDVDRRRPVSSPGRRAGSRSGVLPAPAGRGGAPRRRFSRCRRGRCRRFVGSKYLALAWRWFDGSSET